MPNLLAGAAAGLCATAVMTVPMIWARRTGRVDAIGPEHITAAGYRAIGLELSRREHVAVTAAAHMGYGSAVGAAFALAGDQRRHVLSGLAYATGVAVAGYQAWVPAMGILPPLARAPRGRRTEVMSSHLVYGAVLVAAWNRLTR